MIWKKMQNLIFQYVQIILLGLLNFSWKLRHDRSMGYRGGKAWDLELERPRVESREKAMAPHSNTLAWKIPWMEEPGRLQSMRSLKVGHD